MNETAPSRTSEDGRDSDDGKGRTVPVLTDDAIAYLSTLPAARSRKVTSTGLGIRQLVAALVDVDCVLDHGEEGASSPIASMMAQAGARGTCLTFPHGSRTILLFVWKEGNCFQSISLREEEAARLTVLQPQ